MRVQSPQEHEALGLPQGLPSRALNQHFAALLLPWLDPGKPIEGRAGQVVRRGDAAPAALPWVETGVLEVAMLLDAHGHRVVPVWFGDGEIAMLSSLFGDGGPSVDLVWRCAGRLRWLDKRAIEEAVQAQPSLMGALARFLAQRLREAQQRERGWLERSVLERVRAVLTRKVRGGDRQIGLTQEALAEHCGVSRPKLSAALKSLERAGLVKVHRGSLEILRPEAF